jgi:hypothetical protein
VYQRRVPEAGFIIVANADTIIVQLTLTFGVALLLHMHESQRRIPQKISSTSFCHWLTQDCTGAIRRKFGVALPADKTTQAAKNQTKSIETFAQMHQTFFLAASAQFQSRIDQDIRRQSLTVAQEHELQCKLQRFCCCLVGTAFNCNTEY